MKDKDLRDMAKKVAGEFQIESGFEAFTQALCLGTVGLLGVFLLDAFT